MPQNNTEKIIEEFKRTHYKREIIRATKFLVQQIKRGRTTQEAFEQLENLYGVFIKSCVEYHLSNVL